MIIEIKNKSSWQKNRDIENLFLTQNLEEVTGIELDPVEINTSFRSFYDAHVVTKKSQLKEIDEVVDVIIFCTRAGGGHFAASSALAEELDERGYNVLLIDAFQLCVDKPLPYQAFSGWRFRATHANWLFQLDCLIVGNQFGIDFAYQIPFRLSPKKFLLDFIASKNVKYCVSTYFYPTAICSKIRKICNVGVILTDHSCVGMLPEISHRFQGIDIFYPDENVKMDALKRYPCTKNANFVFDGGVPSSNMEKYRQKEVKPNILTHFVGGALGIGKGMSAVEILVKEYYYPIIIVCGENSGWLKKAKKIVTESGREDVFVLGYVTPKQKNILMANSQVIVAKAGGITSAEMVSLSGKLKIIYGSIKGHEEHQARMFDAEGLLYNCGTNKSMLLQALKKVPISKTVSYNPRKIIADYIESEIEYKS